MEWRSIGIGGSTITFATDKKVWISNSCRYDKNEERKITEPDGKGARNECHRLWSVEAKSGDGKKIVLYNGDEYKNMLNLNTRVRVVSVASAWMAEMVFE